MGHGDHQDTVVPPRPMWGVGNIVPDSRGRQVSTSESQTPLQAAAEF